MIQAELNQLARSERIGTILESVGTPSYLYFADPIDRRWAELVDDGQRFVAEIFYSLKANDFPPLVSHLLELGVGLDCCSAYDLHLAARLGCTGERVTYCSVGFTHDDLAAIVRFKPHVVLSNARQLETVRAAGLPGPFGLRIAVRTVGGFHEHVRITNPDAGFGVPILEAQDLLSREQGAFTGLHCHIGSDVDNADVHLAALDELLDLAHQFDQIEYINLGGGFRVPFVEGEPPYDTTRLHTQVAEKLADFSERTGRNLGLRMEPGSFLARESGVLVATVIDAWETDDAHYVRVDSSTNHLIGALLYNAAHPVAAVRQGTSSEPPLRTTILGNLMQPGDILRSHVRLPELTVGDRILFGLAGAYSAVRSSTFNGRPKAQEHFDDTNSGRGVSASPGSLRDLVDDPFHALVGDETDSDVDCR